MVVVAKLGKIPCSGLSHQSLEHRMAECDFRKNIIHSHPEDGDIHRILKPTSCDSTVEADDGVPALATVFQLMLREHRLKRSKEGNSGDTFGQAVPIKRKGFIPLTHRLG